MGLRRLEPFVLTQALQSLAPFVSTQVCFGSHETATQDLKSETRNPKSLNPKPAHRRTAQCRLPKCRCLKSSRPKMPPPASRVQGLGVRVTPSTKNVDI